jgi:serine/threonine protein kinase
MKEIRLEEWTQTMVGRTIDRKYRLDALLGFGGMGSVYKATRLLIGDMVAVKLLHTEQLQDSQGLERFRREAQAAARLKHPNVVTIHDFGVTEEGLAFLVMELVEGSTLRQLIKQRGALNLSNIAEIVSQIASALDEAHRHDVIHRDLKPDNIIVSTLPTGLRVKVLDFGVARLRDASAGIGTMTQTGMIVGTPYYMSPEQCMGEQLDGRSDIYSLGIMLYEMLAGIVPFHAPSFTAIIMEHISKPPPPLRTMNASISPAVEAVVMHALQKQRDKRPRTATELAQELYTAINSNQNTPSTVVRPDRVKAPPAPPVISASVPKRKLPILLTSCILLLVIAIVVIIGLVTSRQNQSQPNNQTSPGVSEKMTDNSSPNGQSKTANPSKSPQSSDLSSSASAKRTDTPKTETTSRRELQAVINDPDGFTNIRSGPGTQYEIVSKVMEGEIFSIVSQQGSWWQVRTKDGKQGYMHYSRIRILN